jgi:hypothetical protein
MMRLMKAAGAAGLLVAATMIASLPLRATQLDTMVRENQGVVTQLGANTTAISYWISAPDGWHVITTVNTVIGEDTEAEQHAIVRFAATLAPGQTQLISVPVASGERPQVLRIRRVRDAIEMERIADPSM